MTACKITYSLRRNGPAIMSAGSFVHGVDLAVGQTRVTLARGYER